MSDLLGLILRAGPWTSDPDPITKEQLLEILGTTDGAAFAVERFDEAIAEQSGTKAAEAIGLGDIFGFAPDWYPRLLRVFDQEWHQEHEEIVDVLDEEFRCDESLPVLVHAAQWVPGWLAWDDNRALAGKAIWAIGKIGTPEAMRMLNLLAEDSDPVVGERARHQLKRLGATDNPR